MKSFKSNTEPGPAPLPLTSSGTILIVDDEPVVRAMTGAVLTAMGWSILNASSAEDAIQMMHHCRQNGTGVDLVILDLILPSGMSGLEAAQALRAIQPGVRIMACSGFFNDEGDKSCIKLGYDGSLAKPFTADDLAQAVFQCTHHETVSELAAAT